MGWQRLRRRRGAGAGAATAVKGEGAGTGGELSHPIFPFLKPYSDTALDYTHSIYSRIAYTHSETVFVCHGDSELN
jgi:hypothetical protein